MNKILFEGLRRLSAFTFSLGLFQYLNRLGLFASFKGWLFFLPLAFFTVFLILLFERIFKAEKRFHTVVLIILIFIGLTSGSFFGGFSKTPL
jgi:hypothetical protein